MNNLIKIENGEIKLDSRMIAEHFGKRHDNVVADIKDELDKLAKAGIGDILIFQEIEYQDGRNRKQKAYEMSEEGAMQLAARYDAVARRKLILIIKDLKTQSAPKTPAEILLMCAQQQVEQERKLNQISERVDVIKETIIHEPDEWRKEINRMLNRVAKSIGQDYFRRVRTDSYKTLEGKAHVDLQRREVNLKRRMAEEGATKTRLKEVNKLDVIEADVKLREIYTGIVKTLLIKHCA